MLCFLCLSLSRALVYTPLSLYVSLSITVQLSHDILDRAKSPSDGLNQLNQNEESTWNHHGNKIDPIQLQHQLYESYSGLSPIPSDIAQRSSLNALKTSSTIPPNMNRVHTNNQNNTTFDRLFPPGGEQFYDNSAISQQHHHMQQAQSQSHPNNMKTNTTSSRGPSRQRGPGAVVMSQDEDFPYLKFRHGSGGDYVKDLVSPTYRAKSATRPTTAPPPTAIQSAKSRSLSAGRSSSTAFVSPHPMESQA